MSYEPPTTPAQHIKNPGGQEGEHWVHGVVHVQGENYQRAVLRVLSDSECSPVSSPGSFPVHRGSLKPKFQSPGLVPVEC